MVQITATATDSTGKKLIKRITKRKTSKEFKHEDIKFDSFPQQIPEHVKSVEQIEVVPERDVDEFVVIEVTEQTIEESGKKVVKKIKMKQTTPEEVTFETLPDLIEQTKTVVEEVEVIPDVKQQDKVQVTHSVTEETGKRLLKRITKRKASIPEVTFESVSKIIKPESKAKEVIEVVSDRKDIEESVSVEIIETIVDEAGKKKILKRTSKPKEIVPRDANFDTLRFIIYAQDDEIIALKQPKKITLRKTKPEEVVEIVETIDDKDKKIIKKIIKKQVAEIVEGVMGKLPFYHQIVIRIVF